MLPSLPPPYYSQSLLFVVLFHLGFFPGGEFDTYPDWVPSLNGPGCIDQKVLRTKELHRFEQMGFTLQKFETYPDWGAKFCPSERQRPVG
jgi:hypothetical protein